MTMVCGNCGLTGIRWMGAYSCLTHTECPHCGGVNCQREEQDEEQDEPLPEGVYADPAGNLYFICRSCGEVSNLEVEPHEFDPAVAYCGGSPRCLP